ncbi:MAG TPA: RidA family protein [Alphaproteobacteria bacterium]|nr:RidA family protein [Alphaproteobacteria bacterium]
MATETLFHRFLRGREIDFPYSHAVEGGGFVFVAGQVANDPPNEHRALPDDIEGQTRLVMENLAYVLTPLALDFSHLVATRVFLTNFAQDFERMNAVYRTYFLKDCLPARTCIGVTALASGARVEIDAIARRP